MRWLILSLLVGLSNATCVPDCDIGEICKNMWGRMKSGAAFLNPVGTRMNPKKVADDVFVIGEHDGSWFKMVTFNKDFDLLKSKYISSVTATSLDTLTLAEYNSAGDQQKGGKVPCDGIKDYCAGDFTIGTDLSTDQLARASSASDNTSPGMAVDGSLSQQHPDQWHSKNEGTDFEIYKRDAWWGVQLRYAAQNFDVKIYLRNCCNDNGSRDIEVVASNTFPADNTPFGNHPYESCGTLNNLADSSITTISCAMSQAYEYVILRPRTQSTYPTYGYHYFHLPEVFVTSCDGCPAGKYNDEEGQTSCKDCPAGMYTHGTGSTGISACVCATGYYPFRGSCRVCGTGKYNDQLGSACKSCAAGKYNGETGSIVETACKDCQPGKNTGAARQSICQECVVGRYQNEYSATSCKVCPTGYYQDIGSGDSCKTCDPLHKSLSDKSGCFYSGCDLGQSRNGDTCTACQSGKYQDQFDQPSCIDCPSGTTSGVGAPKCFSNCGSSNWVQLGNDVYGENIGDQSGFSVSLSSNGNVMAVGAPFNDGRAHMAGHVRVYKREGINWVQMGNDIEGEDNDADHSYLESGYSVSLSADGAILAIGSRKADPILTDRRVSDHGHVRVFRWNETNWNQMGDRILGENAKDWSGTSVSLSSNGFILAIGAPQNDHGGTTAGAVYVYEWSGTVWNQLGDDINGGASYDKSGHSVSLSSDGHTVAIGAYDAHSNYEYDTGHVRVFHWNGSTWNQIGINIDGEAYDDRSGHSVSLNGDGSIVAIGANSNDGNGLDAGHVRVYVNQQGQWSQMGSDIDGFAAYDGFGNSVSLSSDGFILAVGAPYNGDGGSNSGLVVVYRFNGYEWEPIYDPIIGTTGDKFGYSVSLSSYGNIVAIGSISQSDDSGVQTGAVQVYSSICACSSGSTLTSPCLYGDGADICEVGYTYHNDVCSSGCGAGQYTSTSETISLSLSNTYFCESEDHTGPYEIRVSSTHWYTNFNWYGIDENLRLDHAAGLGLGDDRNGNMYASLNPGSSFDYYTNSRTTCQKRCKDEADRFAVIDTGVHTSTNNHWYIHCYCLKTDGSSCAETDATTTGVTDGYSYGSGAVAVYDITRTITSECLVCGTGTYQTDGTQASCESCEIGQYQDQTGQSSCKNCDTGQYQNIIGQSLCKSCQPGTYQDERGQSSCNDCAVDYYQEQSNQISCKPCESGNTLGATGSTECVACAEGQYSNISTTIFGLELDSTYFCESEDHTVETIITRRFTNNADWDNYPGSKRLSIGAGLANKDGEVDGNEPHDNVYGNDYGEGDTPDNYKTCYTKCKDVDGVQRIAVGDHGYTYQKIDKYSFDRWIIRCYCLKTDGSSCSQADAKTSVDIYSRGTGDVAVYRLLSTKSVSCTDCEIGKYQTDGLQESCKSCQEGYQDETGQTSCKTCPTGYQYKDGVTCDFCPYTDSTHPSYTVWGSEGSGSGCPPWSTIINGCFCDCGDSGFTGDNCDVCGKGNGWNGVSDQGANCTDCLYPYVNDQITHDAVCSHDYCPPGSGTTQDQNTWSADNTTENCVPCTGITVSPDYYGQCADIVCDDQKVPKSVIDHTLDIDDQSNCEDCPSDKVKHGNQCVTPECPNGIPKDKDRINQALSYNDPLNCDLCPVGSIKYGITCVPESCQAGTGTSVNEYPYVLKFTQVHNGYTVGVEGDLTLVVYESDGTRISLTLDDSTGATVITDLAFVGDRLAVVVREFDSTKSPSQYYSGRVEFFEITEPLGIQAEIYNQSPHVISCGTHVYETAICQHISVDGETYYLGYDTKVEEYNNDVVVATHNIRGAHVSVGGDTIAGGSLWTYNTFAYIELIHDGTKKTKMLPSWDDQIKSVAVRNDGAFVAVGTYDKNLFIWDVTQSSPIEVSLSQDADTLEWLGGDVVVGHANGLDVYDTDGTHVRQIIDETVTHLSLYTKGSVFPATVILNVQTDSLFKQMDMECSQCVAPFVNDGSSLTCTRVECSGNQSIKLTGVDVTLAFDNATNCGPCSGYNSGDPCLPIECGDGWIIKPYLELTEGIGDIIDHTLAHTDQTNCFQCEENQVIVDNECTNIVCDKGKEIHRVSGAYAPSDDRNCRDCTGLTVGDGKVCIDIDCGIRRINSTVNVTLGFADDANCGDSCPGGHIVNQTDKTKCSACTGLTVPNKERNECIVPVCEGGFKLKDDINNTHAEGMPSYINNCEDIDECDPNPCQGQCGNMRGNYVCNDDIKMGHDIGKFIRNNLHLCPHGFVLSTEQPTSVSDIGDLDGNFMCPDFITYNESISYKNEIMTSSMIEDRTNGVFSSQYCSYNYIKLKHSEEEFTEDRYSDMDSGKVYIYCPFRCPHNPCEDDQACVDGSCVEHTCTDNAQADGCYCYGSQCTGYCMDNGECVDILENPNTAELENAFYNGVSQQD